MAKMTNTKSLVAGSLLKWIVTAALLIVLILLITANIIVAESGVIVIAAISMLVPSVIAYALYFSWYSKYVPKKTNDGSGRVDVPTSGFKKGADSKTITAIIFNLIFAIVGAILVSVFYVFGDIGIICVYLIVSAIVFSAIDFVVFHIGMFKPNK